MEKMQADPEVYRQHYNHERPHQGRMMEGRTPLKSTTGPGPVLGAYLICTLNGWLMSCTKLFEYLFLQKWLSF